MTLEEFPKKPEGTRRNSKKPEGTRRNPKRPGDRGHPGVIPRSSLNEMVLGKRKGISLDGISTIILTIFLPHTLKFQNPKFCGVSQHPVS
jgi:hypothetical protein